MKHFHLFLFVFINVNLYAQLTQATLTLQPGPVEGKDATISTFTPNSPMRGGEFPEIVANAWTISGNYACYRSLIDFDLSSIPGGAIITNATLYLFWNDTLNSGHSVLSGSNSSVIQRITSSWNEATVTWNTRPTITTINQVFIPQSSSSTQNYAINITNLVQDYYNNPSGSFGFMLRLETEVQYRSIVFGSSDHLNPGLRPKLVVDYTYDLSVEETEYSKMISVFPNPSSDYLSINAPFNFTYELYTITGEKVSEEKNLINALNNHTINVSEFAKGIYMLNFRLENGTEVKKNITIH